MGEGSRNLPIAELRSRWGVIPFLLGCIRKHGFHRIVILRPVKRAEESHRFSGQRFQPAEILRFAQNDIATYLPAYIYVFSETASCPRITSRRRAGREQSGGRVVQSQGATAGLSFHLRKKNARPLAGAGVLNSTLNFLKLHTNDGLRT